MLLIPFERRGAVNTQVNLHNAIRYVNRCLYENIPVYQSTCDTELKTVQYGEGHIFPGGTIVLDTGDRGEGLVTDTLDQNGFSMARHRFRRLNKPDRIALYAGLNTADFCSVPYRHVLDSMNFRYEELDDNDIRTGKLADFRLLIVPGGPDAGESYYQGLGLAGFDRIRAFLATGGKYLGSCAGSYFPLTGAENTVERRCWLNIADTGDRDGLNYWRTGAGLVRLSVSGGGPLTFGLEYGSNSTVDVMYWEGPVFSPAGSEVSVFARYSEFIASGSCPPFWDISSNASACEMINWYNALDPVRFERKMRGLPAAVSTAYGDGRLVLYSFHPEFGYPNCEFEKDPVHLFISNTVYELFS